MSNNQGTQVSVQCPYTASNCPLFNPIFTSEEINGSASSTSQVPSSKPPAVSNSYTDYSLAPSPLVDSWSPKANPSSQSQPLSSSNRTFTSGNCGGSTGCGSGTNTPASNSSNAGGVNGGQRYAVQPQELRSVEQDVEDLFGGWSASGILSPPIYSAASTSYNSNTTNSNQLPPLHQQQQHQQQTRSVSPQNDQSPDLHSVSSPETVADGAAGGSGNGQNGDLPEIVTPFISKLSHLLSHEDYRDFIRWNDAGDSFIFAHTSPMLLDVFGRFFRHANVHSFVRQLNIYGFVRLSTLALLSALDNYQPLNPSYPQQSFSASDYSGFSHPLFFRDEPHTGRHCDLAKIKPKTVKVGARGGAKEGGASRKRKTNAGANGEDARKKTR